MRNFRFIFTVILWNKSTFQFLLFTTFPNIYKNGTILLILLKNHKTKNWISWKKFFLNILVILTKLLYLIYLIFMRDIFFMFVKVFPKYVIFCLGFPCSYKFTIVIFKLSYTEKIIYIWILFYIFCIIYIGFYIIYIYIINIYIPKIFGRLLLQFLDWWFFLDFFLNKILFKSNVKFGQKYTIDSDNFASK